MTNHDLIFEGSLWVRIHTSKQFPELFLFQSTHHYPPEKHTHQSPVPYSEGSTGVAVVTPTPNATVVAAATSAATSDRPKTKNITGPPVYYPPGVELFAKKEESMALQVSTGSNRLHGA